MSQRINVRRGVLIAAAVAGVLGAVAVVAGEPPPDPTALARGAKSWADHCARCHNMRNPQELRDDQWRAVVTHMRERGGLTGQQAREILIFLQGSN